MTSKQILAKQKKDTEDLMAMRYIERNNLICLHGDDEWVVGSDLSKIVFYDDIPGAKSLSDALKLYKKYLEDKE